MQPEWEKSRKLSTQKNHVTSLHTKSRNLSIKKIMQPLHKKMQPLHKKNLVRKIMQPLHKKKSCNLSTQKIMQPLNNKKNHATCQQQKNHAPLYKKKSCKLSTKNIARIAKRCPENIISVVKCVKLLFKKNWRKKNMFVYSSDSSDSSEKNHKMSQQKMKQRLNEFFLLLFNFSALFERATWHIWQPMWCSQGSMLRFL